MMYAVHLEKIRFLIHTGRYICTAQFASAFGKNGKDPIFRPEIPILCQKILKIANYVMMTSFGCHDLNLKLRGDVHWIFCEAFITCNKFQVRTPLGSVVIKISRFVANKVIFHGVTSFYVMTSFWRNGTMSNQLFVKCLLSVLSFKFELLWEVF